MVFVNSPETAAAGAAPPVVPLRLKIVVVGGFGVGKTTLVDSASDTTALFTDAIMTQASTGLDDLAATPDKTTTTVAMDFGTTLLPAADIKLYLFGVPGQERFTFMWDRLVIGALGGIVLVDTRRAADCFRAVAHLEQHQVPFLVAVNCFPGAPLYTEDQIRESLNLPADVPVLYGDARSRSDALKTLTTLTEYLLSLYPDDEDAQ